jgi:four helix bundle protein
MLPLSRTLSRTYFREEKIGIAMQERFSYQNLRVYEDMIRAISLGEEITSGWDSVHAITDHFARASEGALLCFAESSRKRQTPARTEAAGHSLGLILECAACFDISVCKSLVRQKKCNEVKKMLSSVFRQLYALRRSWQAEGELELRESPMEYGDNHVFHHERLKTYQLALQVNHHIASWRFVDRLPRSDFRRIDEAATSIVLNIAEGNGRFAHLDHSRFLDIANQATTKAAARLEISAIRGEVTLDKADKLVCLLVEIDKMTAKLASVWKKEV